MKHSLNLLLLLAATTFAHAELFKNGDFESGSTGWKGDRRITEESAQNINKVCRVKIDDEDQRFYQKVKVKDARGLYMSFKVKTSEDYDGRGISIRFEQGRKNTFYDRSVDSTEWKDVSIKFSDILGDEILVVIVVRSGEEGYLDFDDFQLKAE